VVDQVKSQQTKAGMERARAQGKRLGRPGVPPEVRTRIAVRRAEGASLRTICRELNTDQVPTGHGARTWQPGSVAWILRTLEQQRTRSNP